MEPIIVKKGWVMYEVEKPVPSPKNNLLYCLYKSKKCGCADSIGFYADCDSESEAIIIFKSNIPFITAFMKEKQIKSLGGTTCYINK